MARNAPARRPRGSRGRYARRPRPDHISDRLEREPGAARARRGLARQPRRRGSAAGGQWRSMPPRRAGPARPRLDQVGARDRGGLTPWLRVHTLMRMTVRTNLLLPKELVDEV